MSIVSVTVVSFFILTMFLLGIALCKMVSYSERPCKEDDDVT